VDVLKISECVGSRTIILVCTNGSVIHYKESTYIPTKYTIAIQLYICVQTHKNITVKDTFKQSYSQ